MKTIEKASPFSENGRGSNNNLLECKGKEIESLLKGLREETEEKETNTRKFPLEVFPDFYRDLMIELKSTLDFEPDYTGGALLFVISLTLGNKMKLRINNGWLEKANLYITTVGKPGEGKSQPAITMLQPLMEIERELYDNFKIKMAEYEAELENGNTLPKPQLYQFLLNDATLESILKYHAINEKGVGIYVDEIRGFIKSLNKYRNGNDVETILTAFSGGALKMTRATKDTERIDDSFISILGSIQPELLQDTFQGQKMNNGFIDRFLFCWPERSKRIRWADKLMNQAFLDRYVDNVKVLYCYVEELEKPFILEFSKKAKKTLFQWQHKNPEEFNSNFERGAFIKLENYVMRFCIILHVLHNFSKTDFINEIREDIVKKAIRLFDYFYYNALQVEEQLTANYYDSLTIKQKAFFDKLPNEFKTGYAVKLAIENDLMSERSVKNLIKDSKLFRKVAHGLYEKIIY